MLPLVAWQGRLLPPGVLALGACCVALFAALVLLRSRGPRAAVVAAVCVCAAAAGLATAARVHARRTGPLAQAARSSSSVTVEGVLTDDPRAVPPKADVLTFRQLVVAHVRVERLLVAGRDVHLREPVLILSSDEHWLGLLPSQHLSTEGRVQSPGVGDDVAALVSTRGPPRVLGAPTGLQRLAGRLRAGLRAAAGPLPGDERGLLPGLVEGDTSRLDPGLNDDFRATGLTHIVAVSGTNVAVVLAAALVVCGWLRIGLRWRAPAAALVLLAFVVLARPSPSVLRAAVMGGIALVALATGSRRQALPALSAAVLVLLLLSPELAGSPGFALSTLATAGLLLLAPSWREQLEAWLPRWAPRWCADALAVPAAAQVACGPVIVAISGQVGLLAVPANLLAVPAVGPATVLGVLAAVLAPVCLPLAQGAAWLAYLPTAWLVRVARVGAGLPGAQVALPTGGLGALLMVLLTAAVLLIVRHRLLRRAVAAGLVGCLLALLGVSVTRPSWPPPGWVMVTCDVGQGVSTRSGVLGRDYGDLRANFAGRRAGRPRRCCAAVTQPGLRGGAGLAGPGGSALSRQRCVRLQAEVAPGLRRPVRDDRSRPRRASCRPRLVEAAEECGSLRHTPRTLQRAARDDPHSAARDSRARDQQARIGVVRDFGRGSLS